jgi:D-proline reductase (dithiol) PrdB
MDSFRFMSPFVRIVMKNYPYLRYDNCPFTPLKKPLKDCKVALVTTGGFYVEGEQEPFDMEREKTEYDWGDPTYRIIPRDVTRDRLKVVHRHYNKSGVRSDINVMLPLDRFAELESTGEIGLLAHYHYSFQGNLPNIKEVILEYGPQVAMRLYEDGVDFVFMTPD